MPIPAADTHPLVSEHSTQPQASGESFAGSHPIRALHVVNGEHYSGAERVQDLLAQALPGEGCSVGFATLKQGVFDQTRQCHNVALTPLFMKNRLDIAAAGRLARLATTEQYDLLHAHTPRALLIASIAARRLGIPLVYHVHSPVGRDSTRWLQNKLNTLVEKHCLRIVDRIIVVSPTLIDYMIGLGVDRQRIACVPNGVPIVADQRVRHRTTADSLTLGMVALFRPRKGAEVLLDALANANSQGLSIHLRLIGGFESPEYEQQLRQRADRLGIASSITWVGFTSNVAAELANIDTLVLPSLFGEGLPMVVLEAMAAGVPVVATHVEGTTLAVTHRETGLLVEPGCVSALASTIVEIAGGEIDLLSLATAARDRQQRCFSTLSMAAGVAEAYRAVLQTRLARH